MRSHCLTTFAFALMLERERWRDPRLRARLSPTMADGDDSFGLRGDLLIRALTASGKSQHGEQHQPLGIANKT